MGAKFIDAESAIKKFYKNQDDFYKAVREGDEALYIPVKTGTVFSFFNNYLTPYFKVPEALVTPVNHGFVSLLRVPEIKIDELETFGVCHCDIFDGAACLDQEGNFRKFELGAISQVPDADGGCSVEVEPERALVEQVKQGGIYEVAASPEWGEWPIGQPDFAKAQMPELEEGEAPCWFRSDEDESRVYEAMLPISPGKDRQGNLKARLLAYSFGVYDQSESLVENLALGVKLKAPKTLTVSLRDIKIVDRKLEKQPKKDKPEIDINSEEVILAVKKLISQYEIKAQFTWPHFSTRLDHYLKVLVAHWMACKSGKRPVSGCLQRDVLKSPMPILKQHAKSLSEYALNRYSADNESAKSERIKKACRDDEPWLLSVVPTMLELWRDHVATLKEGIANDPKEWGDDLKRALVSEGLPEGAPTVIAALIAPDNTDMSDKYNKIKR